MATLLYETKDFIKTFHLMIEKRAAQHDEIEEKQYSSNNDLIGSISNRLNALLKNNNLENKQDHLILIFQLIQFYPPFSQTITQDEIVNMLELTTLNITLHQVESILHILKRLGFIESADEHNLMGTSYRAILGSKLTESLGLVKQGTTEMYGSRLQIGPVEIFIQLVGEARYKECLRLYLQHFIESMKNEVTSIKERSIANYFLEYRETIMSLLLHLRFDNNLPPEINRAASTMKEENKRDDQAMAGKYSSVISKTSTAREESIKDDSEQIPLQTEFSGSLSKSNPIIDKFAERSGQLISSASMRLHQEALMSKTSVENVLVKYFDHENLIELAQQLNISDQVKNDQEEESKVDLNATVIQTQSTNLFVKQFKKLLNNKLQRQNSTNDAERTQYDEKIKKIVVQMLKTQEGQLLEQEFRLGLNYQAVQERVVREYNLKNKAHKNKEIAILKELGRLSLSNKLELHIKNIDNQSVYQTLTELCNLESLPQELTMWEQGFVLMALLVALNEYPEQSHNTEINQLNEANYALFKKEERKVRLERFKNEIFKDVPYSQRVEKLLEVVEKCEIPHIQKVGQEETKRLNEESNKGATKAGQSVYQETQFVQLLDYSQIQKLAIPFYPNSQSTTSQTPLSQFKQSQEGMIQISSFNKNEESKGDDFGRTVMRQQKQNFIQQAVISSDPHFLHNTEHTASFIGVSSDAVVSSRFQNLSIKTAGQSNSATREFLNSTNNTEKNAAKKSVRLSKHFRVGSALQTPSSAKSRDESQPGKLDKILQKIKQRPSKQKSRENSAESSQEPLNQQRWMERFNASGYASRTSNQ
ncbi:hypothetical protein FGO68_gene12748 [Halteria grandinella]|uniref:Uncharacterized protein n=1 Tax=Halteria grandinella TaxID=5974 RepID=A0A8J8SXE5_HALGN|nr:hypothetical protein FGO68_gene12748 [Halteria grandinella]